jgi:7-carboxy-7-deazaguanine synthase
MQTENNLKNQDLLRLNGIYPAIEGEGVWVGMPQIFVRLQGCQVGCRNCDSKDTWSFNKGNLLSVEQVISEIERHSLLIAKSKDAIRRISITGGDPTDPQHLPGVFALAKELKSRRYTVTLEASGNAVPHHIFDLLDYINFDFKTPSTGVETDFNHLLELAKHYAGRFQIKSVVQSLEDFEYCLKYKTALGRSLPDVAPFSWIITPAFSPGEEFPKQRFQDIYGYNFAAGAPFRVIAQQHKWIFGPDRKNI